MVVGAIVGAIVGAGLFIGSYELDTPKHVFYNATLGAIFYLLFAYTAPYSLGLTLFVDNSATMVGICIAGAIIGVIPLINILYGLTFGAFIGYSIEILLKSADWSWLWGWKTALIIAISLLLLVVVYAIMSKEEHENRYPRGRAGYGHSSSGYQIPQGKKVNSRGKITQEKFGKNSQSFWDKEANYAKYNSGTSTAHSSSNGKMVHIGRSGNIIGLSKKEGDKEIHYDRNGNIGGLSKKETGLLGFGGEYTQHYNREGRKGGFDREKTLWGGEKYTQHYDKEGHETGFSKKETTWSGRTITKHYDKDGHESGVSYDESSGDSGGDSGGSGCFITTACVQAQGLPDNCLELQKLRVFRDQYLIKIPYGHFIIKEYYRISPLIIQEINKRGNPECIYQDIFEKWIAKALVLIDTGKKEEALLTYIEMVKQLSQKYL